MNMCAHTLENLLEEGRTAINGVTIILYRCGCGASVKVSKAHLPATKIINCADNWHLTRQTSYACPACKAA